MALTIDIITLFPEMVTTALSTSILRRAQEQNIVKTGVHNLRDFGLGKHRSVDDSPYGGGPGMIMRLEPIVENLEAIEKNNGRGHRILLTPRGTPFSQVQAERLAKKSHLVFICGRYEGVDERITDYIDEEISIGDFILTGGELAALVVIDSVIRLQEGALRAESTEDESFTNDLLEYPQYTKPLEFRGVAVPEVLLSGNHQKIKAWRKEQSILATKKRRPDLLTEED